MTIRVDPPPVASPAQDDRMTALLRKARERGVTSFDVARSRYPERAERLIARAFPEADPPLLAVVGRSLPTLARQSAVPGEAPRATASLEDALVASLDESRQRLAPVPLGIIEWTGTDDRNPSLAAREELALAMASSKLADLTWSLPLPTAGLVALPSPPGAVSLFSGELSLLHPDIVALFEGEGPPPDARLMARDPFDSGRLDGTRFRTGTSLGAPGTPPADVRRLHEEFDPVLRLGFLTSGHRRTLAQAALQFVLHWGWVASAVVPLPEAERLDEVLGYGECPPLEPEDLARLASLK